MSEKGTIITGGEGNGIDHGAVDSIAGVAHKAGQISVVAGSECKGG